MKSVVDVLRPSGGGCGGDLSLLPLVHRKPKDFHETRDDKYLRFYISLVFVIIVMFVIFIMPRDYIGSVGLGVMAAMMVAGVAVLVAAFVTVAISDSGLGNCNGTGHVKGNGNMNETDQNNNKDAYSFSGGIAHDPGGVQNVEIDPTGRYFRFHEVLGKGALTTIFKSFDQFDGIEVAWNIVKIGDFMQSPESAETLEKLNSEVNLLRQLKHENVIKLYSSWIDYEKKTINIITELFTSGSLKQYRQKHKIVDMKVIKNWARQILRGLEYLHGHNPPIVHLDLKCDNIFVNGNQGELKLGGFGLATFLQEPTQQSFTGIFGTPGFMAPELYEGDYNELVDIYSFGMCMLEMVTLEYPYNECKNVAEIYHKVSSGEKPDSLSKVEDPKLREFIEKCLVKAPERSSAKDLLRDSFLCMETNDEISRPTASPHSQVLDCQRDCPYTIFRVNGQKNEDNSIYLTLRISDPCGKMSNIHFSFYPDIDTAVSVSGEMVDQLGLPDHDVYVIAGLINSAVIEEMNPLDGQTSTSTP